MRKLWPSPIHLALALCAALQPGATLSAERDRSGVYSSLRTSAETGDVGGFELEISGANHRTAVFAACEGGCWGGEIQSLVIRGSRISFTVLETWYDERGDVSERRPVRYEGRFLGDSLLLRSPDKTYFGQERLKRVADPLPGQTAGWATY
jgi:hypothetical protein